MKRAYSLLESERPDRFANTLLFIADGEPFQRNDRRPQMSAGWEAAACHPAFARGPARAPSPAPTIAPVNAAAPLDTMQLAALAAALGWASGLRLYAVLFLAGAAAALGFVELPRGLGVLEHPLLLAASGFMLFVEFFADKIPGVDTLWDLVHTVVRIPAGAALAAGVFGGDEATWAAAAAVLGGSLAATSHAAKATTRAAVNTSPEPFSNIALSLAGDALVPASLWLAWTHPAVFLPLLGLAVVAALVLLWLLARFLRPLVRRLLGRGDRNGALPVP